LEPLNLRTAFYLNFLSIMSAHANHKQNDSPARKAEDHDVENPKPRKSVKVQKSRKERKEARRAARMAARKCSNIIVTILIGLIIGAIVLGLYLSQEGDAKPDEKSSEEAPTKVQTLPGKILIETSWDGNDTKRSIHFKRVDGIQKLDVEGWPGCTAAGFVKGSIYLVDTDHHKTLINDGNDPNLPNSYRNCLLFQVRNSGSLEEYHWVFGTSKNHLCGGKLDTAWEQEPSVLCQEGFMYATKVEGKGASIPDKAQWQACDLEHPEQIRDSVDKRLKIESNPGFATFTCKAEN